MTQTRLLVVGAFVALGIVIAGLLTMGSTTDQRVIVVQTQDTRLRAYVIFPNQPAAPGLAHYTEHLAWLNTVGANVRAADRHSNAWTNDFAIAYWLSGSPSDLPELIGSLWGIFEPLDLPAAFAAQERDIVMSEYELRITGNIDAQTSERLDAHLYEGNAIAQSVIGTPDQIRDLDYDAARAFHAQTHRPELATFVIVGDVTKRQVNRALRDLELPPASPIVAPEFMLAAPAETLFQVPDDKAAARLVFRKVVALDDPMSFDLLEAHTALLSDILQSNVAGGLAGPLRFDAAMARRFEIGIWPMDEQHVQIGFWASPDKDVSLTQLQDTFEAALSDVAASGIPPATYDRILDRFDGFWPDWDDADETSDWMADYVVNRLSIARAPLAMADLRALDAAMSLDTLNALLRHITQEGRIAAAFIGPQETFE